MSWYWCFCDSANRPFLASRIPENACLRAWFHTAHSLAAFLLKKGAGIQTVQYVLIFNRQKKSSVGAELVINSGALRRARAIPLGRNNKPGFTCVGNGRVEARRNNGRSGRVCYRGGMGMELMCCKIRSGIDPDRCFCLILLLRFQSIISRNVGLYRVRQSV